MRVEMEEMEEEREKMVEEVEAQIERALASMTLSDHYESDYSQNSNQTGGRFGGSRSGGSRPGTSSGAGRPLRSFATASTLAGNAVDHNRGLEEVEQDTTMVIEEEDPRATNPGSRKPSIDSKRSGSLAARKRRFSAASRDPHFDGLDAVDVGISQRIDHVSEKMVAIQQKVCSSNRFAETQWLMCCTVGECLRANEKNYHC